MPVPKRGVTVYDKSGLHCDLDSIIEEVSKLPGRLLVDDEVGVSVDVAGLGYQTESMDFEHGRLKRADVSVLHKRKQPAKILRITVEDGIALEVAEDTLLHVRDEDGNIRHVRADKLKPGMSILSGFKDDGSPGFVVY